MPPAQGGVSRGIAISAILVLALIGWVPHLPNSLWLDETLTYWVIQDSFLEALDRALHFQPQPGYYLLMWCWTALAGTSEVALRLPSLIGMLGACVALARLVEAVWGDRETGLLAALVFAASFNAFREAADARSYALGLWCLIACAGYVHAWVQRGGLFDAALAGVLGALLPQFHVFFLMALPAFALYVFAMRPQTPDARAGFAKQGMLVLALLAVGALLYLPVVFALADNAGSYSFARTPTLANLASVFVWTPPVAGLLVGSCALAAGSASDRAPAVPVRPKPVSLFAMWLLVPTLLLFGVSTLGESKLFFGRYLIPAIPAVAFFYALALRALPLPAARIVAALVIVLAALVSHERPEDDFRGAAAAVREFAEGDPELPVLLASGVIEGQHEAWLRDPSLSDYLSAPAAYYPLGGRVFVAPRRLSGQQPLTRDLLSPALRGARRFAAVEWRGNGANILEWLVPNAEANGFEAEVRSFGNVRVAFLTISPGA